MKKYEDLIEYIKEKKIPWQSHTVRSLKAKTGYSHDACGKALKELKKTKIKQPNNASDNDITELLVIKDLSDETLQILLIEALKANPKSEKLIRCAIDFKVKLKRGEGEGTDEINLEELFKMGLFQEKKAN